MAESHQQEMVIGRCDDERTEETIHTRIDDSRA
jgi:hypothetical protein